MTMSPHEKAMAIGVLNRAIEELVKTPTTTVCPDCVHFNMGVCNKWGDAIPADILDKGCEEWEFNVKSPPF